MSKIALTPNASGTGTLTIAAPNTSTDRTLTLPDETGTIISSTSSQVAGPAFSAYQTGNTGFSSGTATKFTYGTEVFDTASCYDTTNSRFTPNVAGYYQVNANAHIDVTSGTVALCWVYKNGSSYKRGMQISFSSGNFSTFEPTVSALVYMNGTTDYIEIYGYCSGTSPSMGGDRWFDAHLARAA